MSRLSVIWILCIFSCNSQSNQDRIYPQVMDITESVYASVTVSPIESYFPQPPRTGIIQEILVEEGDLVRKGQALFRLSPTPDITNRVTNAELTLIEAEANFTGENSLLLNIESELRALKQQLMLDSLNLERQERLWDQNIGKKLDLDRAQLTYEATLSKYEVLQHRYSQTLINLESQYEKARSQVQAERSQLGDFTVRSEIEGRLYELYKEEGESLSPQERFGEIGSADSFFIEMDIDEVDITKIEIGDTVLIALDAYPNEVFVAITNLISPIKDEMTQTFRVESHFEQEPPKLYYGLSGEANIIVDTRADALVIPANYLVQGSKVLTANGEQPVKVGMKNMEFVEVLSGVDTSTELVKPEAP